MTAAQAASIIARECDEEYIVAPMADGGEDTAETLCRSEQWRRHSAEDFGYKGCFFYNPLTREAVIDCSSVIGLQGVDVSRHNLLEASSRPLGEVVGKLIDTGCRRITIGIGGTSTCDGGEGFLLALNHRVGLNKILFGLSDVQVPLLAVPGEPSALMFAPQKGATEEMLPILAEKILRVERIYGRGHSPFDGAGGGLGYAMASVIGCEVVPGADYVFDSYNIDWSNVGIAITGEGRYDRQSSRGKVVNTVQKRCAAHGVPTVVMAGCVEEGMESPWVVDLSRYFPIADLTPPVARLRLQFASVDLFKK